MADGIQIREVGMRDGLQSIAAIMPTETKLAWLDAEYAAGVRDIEVSSFVPPKLLPQLADAEAVVKHALTLPGLTVSALIPNLRGAERGLALGVHEMSQRGAQPLECPARHRRVDRGFPPRRPAVPRAGRAQPAAYQLRPRHRLRLHDRGRCRRGPGAPYRQ